LDSEDAIELLRTGDLAAFRTPAKASAQAELLHARHQRRASPQLLFRLLARCDVARHTELHHHAVAAPHRRGMGFHMDPLAAQVDDVELQEALGAGTDLLVEFA